MPDFVSCGLSWVNVDMDDVAELSSSLGVVDCIAIDVLRKRME